MMEEETILETGNCHCSICLIILFSGGKEAAAHEAWAVIDADTGRLLDGSNENVRLPIASLTKIWTAFTVLESGAPLGITTISPAAASAEGSSIYLQQGVTADVEGFYTVSCFGLGMTQLMRLLSMQVAQLKASST